MFVTLSNNLPCHCEPRLVGARQSDEVVARAKPVAISETLLGIASADFASLTMQKGSAIKVLNEYSAHPS